MKDEGRAKLRTSVRRLSLFVLAAALIWVIGQAIAWESELVPFTSAAAAAALVLVLVRMALELRNTADGLAAAAAGTTTRTEVETVYGENRAGFHAIVYIAYGMAIYMVFRPILTAINPAFASVALILLAISVVVLMFRLDGLLSRAFGDWTARALSRIQLNDTGIRVRSRSRRGEPSAGSNKRGSESG